MVQTATIQRANDNGTMKIYIPKNTRGPDAEPLEPGDTLVYEIKKIEKKNSEHEEDTES